LQNGFAAGERVFGLLEFPVQRLENKSSSVLNKFKEQIRFENIRFKYEKEENNWVLDDVSFAIKKGQTVALVGASGSGKSTLADLLLRFYLPDQGTVSIDGKNIQDIKSESLRKMIGVVSQDVFLLNNSIKLNIAYGDENASDDKIYKAAEIANARDFIEQFEKGWDTVVGDRGVKLSGGQKQRLSIARAVLQDQEILILDEATSSLDNESERLVQESLNLLMEGRTSLIIAHRLSTIRNADKIFVLNKGKIIDSGTHEELLAESAYYQNLYQQQNDSSLES
ncbi:MAG: ATP-binding cassette domain-containing protein, partial [Candidatus Marinimicrobia bacterium]|nr:ATP-binding cassette domain-containing protein [Candidatus Neomarinimicrobiota bacterium]